MKEINVKGTARAAFGKKAAREIRKANAVPCNLYGEAKDENGAPVALPFTVTNDELRNLIYSPDIYAVNLNIDGKECKAIARGFLLNHRHEAHRDGSAHQTERFG